MVEETENNEKIGSGLRDENNDDNIEKATGEDDHFQIRSSSIVSNKESKSSLLLNHSKSIPIVELFLNNVTYQPISSTATAKQQRHSSNSNGNKRTIVLDQISTQIAPGQLTAWMGPSGSGKTSLTSVVAGLVRDPADIQGEIKVNGEEGRLPKQMVGVVWQDDLLLSNLSVEETIYFSARLKTPSETTDKEVRTLVKETMEELGLLHIRDHLIGSAVANMPGISGGERKRTAVAVELVVRPSLLLLDEPTSGLDATTAFSLMTTLKELAMLGHSIAVVIHQPRTDIFKLLDHLLLLSKGRVIYNGPAASARSYLETCPNVDELPPETGIADWIMDSIISDESKRKNAILADHWAKHQTMTTDVKSVTAKRPLRRMSTLTELQQTPKRFEASLSNQLKLLLGRTLKQRRGEKFTRVSILLTLTYLFFTSLFWWRMPDTTAWIFERNSLIFFMLIAQGNGIVVSSVTVFQRERALLRRERAKKMYGVLPYFIAKAVSDMTNNVFLPLCYGMVAYFAAGLRPTFVHFLKFTLGYYLSLNCAQSMGFFLSILIPNMQIALILAPPITLFFFIMGGFYIPLSNIHIGIRWASYLSFARYGYSALLVNEFAGRDIPCSDEDVAISIGDAEECPLPGDSVYEGVGIEGLFSSYWFNIAIVAILQVFFLACAYGLLRRSK